MTNKQEQILNAALKLFAEDGFKGTSTSKIAKEAGVSEGLIFRHFKNKNGLLAAVLEMGEEKAKQLFADIIFEEDPKSVIRKTIAIGDLMQNNQADINFWKLQYKVKWEIETYGEHKIEAVEQALAKAFTKLNYPSPEIEARMLMVLIDGLATRLFLQKSFDLKSSIQFLREKYQV